MEPFTAVVGPAASLVVPNIDTDLIAPAHGGRGDLGSNAFAPLRYLPDGAENPSFVLNQDAFRGAPILLAGPNFGCGSSRESAVWALRAIGVSCVIAPSFGDIFAGNCVQNGVLALELDPDTVERLAAEAVEGDPMTVDLWSCSVTSPRGTVTGFTFDPTRRIQLLEGLDDLALGLRRLDQVRAFEAADQRRRPWVYSLPGVSGHPR